MKGMGVDLSKLPEEEEWCEFLKTVISTPFPEKSSYCLIWEVDNEPIGHCNVTKIEFGVEAYMHLHIWNQASRTKGLASDFLKKTIPLFFKNLKLQELYCEPWVENFAPNKALPKAGFEFSHSYFGIPGSLNFEQNVNVYRFKKESLLDE